MSFVRLCCTEEQLMRIGIGHPPIVQRLLACRRLTVVETFVNSEGNCVKLREPVRVYPNCDYDWWVRADMVRTSAERTRRWGT